LLFDHAERDQLVISPALLAGYLEVTARPELMRRFKSLPGQMRDLRDLLSSCGNCYPCRAADVRP